MEVRISDCRNNQIYVQGIAGKKESLKMLPCTTQPGLFKYYCKFMSGNFKKTKV